MTALLAALLLDAALGEPDAIWRRVPHPAVLMGRAVARLDGAMNRGGARRAKGAAAAALLMAGAAAAGWAVSLVPFGAPVGAAILLAQRSLAQHVGAVAAGLRSGLPEGRAAVARIVGRDTAAMDGPAIARAAIESASENLSDGVVAPAFWFAVGGLPAMAAYKALNTADSMIGHRTPRHEAFGWAAARADDVANLIPARLTALAIAALHGGLAGWTEIAREARRHRSPNAGWPEAAAARALGVALSGPRSYGGRPEPAPFVHPAGRRDPGPAEIDAAVRLLWRTWGALTLIVALAALAAPALLT